MSLQKLFFSYSRNDAAAFATQLAKDLGNEGFDVWIDQQDIRAGMEWDLEIEKALENCDCLLFIESEKSVASNNVLDEVYYALGQNKKVIPVIYHDSKTPFRLQRLQHIDFTKDYKAGLADLVSELKGTMQSVAEPSNTWIDNSTGSTSSKRRFTLLITLALVMIAAVAGFAIFYFTGNKAAVAPTPAVIPTENSTTKADSNNAEKTPNIVITEEPLENQLLDKNVVGNGSIPKTTRQETAKGSHLKAGKKSAEQTAIKASNSMQKVPATVLPGNLLENFMGNWTLNSVVPKPASHRGYIKIEALDDTRAKIVSNFQFYYKRPNAPAYLAVFNGFASCASCLLKPDMKIIEKDISIGSNSFTILKKDVPGEGKAGDTTASYGANTTLSAIVTMQLLQEDVIVIKVQHPAALPISEGLTVPPFVYSFYFKKNL